MVILMVGAMVFIPFVGIATKLVARVEGEHGVLTFTMLIGGVGNMILSFYPAIWWLTAAFRPDRDPELIRLMNDMAWLQFIGGVTLFLAMPLTMVVLGFVDNSPTPLVPRWAGYASAWASLLIICDQVLFFFKTGPFAWNGAIGMWMPVVIFGLYFVMFFYLVRTAVLRDRVDAARLGSSAA